MQVLAKILKTQTCP